MINFNMQPLKKLFLLLSVILSSQHSFSQVQWNFNTGTLQGWALTRFTSSFTASTVVLTTTTGNNPTITINPTSINAGTYKYLKIQLKNHSDGPTLLYTNIGTHKSRVISQNDASIKTYYIDLTDAAWTGTITSFYLQFKINDNSVNGATFNAAGKIIEIQSISFVENIYSGASALYIDPSFGDDNNDGSITSPLKSISKTVNICASNNISNAYVKSGTYNISAISFTTVSPHLITLSPEPGGSAKIVLSNFKSIRFYSGAKNIEIKGFEIDGSPIDPQSHWDMLSQYVWQPSLLTTAKAGGGIAFQIEVAEDIKITDNYIHDFYQKAINIEDGRYITVQGNIIHNIAQRSLSGGHGIMRQQGSGSFSDADNASKYRWDISENLIYNVAQRIYSWVPSKGYMNMTLDEGKPILIDETPNHDVNMKARIKNNVIAYSHIDAVRLKPTNNLEVINNTIFTTNEHADGITDVASGFNSSLYGTPYLNFTSSNNAVQVTSSSMPYELNETYASTNSSFSNNISKSGTISPSSVGTNINTDLFIDPLAGNFRLKPSITYTAGVQSSVLTALDAKATSFSVSVATDNWVHNHKKNAQTLLDNFPGVDDGVSGNETIFTSAGSYARSDLEWVRNRKSMYIGITDAWKSANGVTNSVLNHRSELNAYDGMYELVLPEDYSTWYDDIITTYLRDADNNGTDDSPYDRIRYGESIIKQDKIFNNNSLHVVEISSASTYSITNASGYHITLDGDILFDFSYTPIGNESFDVLLASDITSANPTDIFDRVRFSGYTGTYTLAIINSTPKSLRLTLTAASSDAISWYLDADNDGYYTGSPVSSVSSPGAGYRSSGLLGGNDCDDNNAAIYATVIYYVDADGDGYGSSTTSALCSLTPPAGYSTNNTDCNDNNINVWQSGGFYIDVDGDGYTTASTTVTICYGNTLPSGYTSTTLGVDCDDSEASLTTGCSSITNVYYVSPTGSNDNNGKSTFTPFSTISYASTVASHGDKIYVMAGTYSNTSFSNTPIDVWSNESTVEILNKLTSDSNKYLIIKPLTPNTVTLKGNGVNIVLIRNSNNIKFEGFIIQGEASNITLSYAREYQFTYKDASGNILERVPRGSTDDQIAAMTLPILSGITRPSYFNTSGIMVGNSHHVDVLNNVVNNMPGEGIRSFDSDFLNIIGNEVYSCSSRSATGVHGLSVYTANSSIDAANSTYSGIRILISKNKVYNNVNGLYSWSSTKTHIDPKIDEGKGITVQRCTPAYGWNDGIIRIENNIAYLNGFSGVHVNSGNRIEIINNTVYNNNITSATSGIGNAHGISVQDANDIIIANNIAQSYPVVASGNALNISANSGTSGYITVEKNLIYGTESSSFASNITGSSPLFVNPSTGDFSLQETSPAINAASNTYAPSTDYLGNTRSNPDLGALEYVGPVTYTWTGSSSTTWSLSSNWTPAGTPEAGSNLIINNVTNNPVFSGTSTYKNLTLTGSGNLTLSTLSQLGITENLVVNGTIAGSGKLKMAGNTLQTISGTGSISNLEIDNTAGVSIITGAGNMLTLTGKLIPTSGTLTTNGNLTLRSNAAGTARVGQGNNSGGYVSGDVITQRYLSKVTGSGRSGRAWRLVTTPVTGTRQLREIFMGSQLGADLTLSGNRSAQPANLGTVVIGHNQGNASEATGNGYDWLGVAGQVSSLRYYQQNTTSGSFASSQVPSLSTTYTAAAQGYMLFARGDRQQTYNGTNHASTTTLQATGTLKQGTIDVTIPALASAGFVLVGNPYMAVLDLEKVIVDNAGVIDQTVYIWDANIDGNPLLKQGGYRALTRTGVNNWTASGAGANPQYIESGTAFFVKPTASGGTLHIMESHKVDGTPGIAPHSSMTDGPSRFFINLEVSDSINRRLVDGAVAFFDPSYQTGLGDAVDIEPISNLTTGSITLRQSGKRLSMEGRPWPVDTAAGSIPVDMRNLSEDPFVLRIIPTNMQKVGFTASLKDKHLNRETMLKTDEETLYPFRRTGNAGIDSSRFEIVYRLSKPTNTGTLTPDGAIRSITPRLYPNPAKAEDVQLSLGSLEPGHYEVRVLDMSGRSVLTKPVTHVNVANVYQILKGHKLLTGQYLIRISRNGKLLETLSFIHK